MHCVHSRLNYVYIKLIVSNSSIHDLDVLTSAPLEKDFPLSVFLSHSLTSQFLFDILQLYLKSNPLICEDDVQGQSPCHLKSI